MTYTPFTRTFLALTAAMALVLTMGAAKSARAAEAPIYEQGFEHGLEGFGQNGQVEVVTDVAHGGKASLRIQSGFAYTDNPKGVLIPVDGKHDYRLSVWIKTDKVGAEGATLQAVARGGAKKGDAQWLGTWIEGNDPKFLHDNGASAAIVATGGTHDWQRFEALIPARQLASGAQFLMVYFRHDVHGKATTGTVWFDDLSVEALAEGTVPRSSGPLIRNGGFEQGKQGWGGPGAQIAQDQAAAGKSSLKVEQGFAFEKVDVQGQQRYRLSMKIKSVDAGDQAGFVQLSYRGKGLTGWEGPVQVHLGGHNEAALFVTGGSHDWREFSAVIQAPRPATELFIYLRKQAGPGAVYYDEVSMTPTEDAVTQPGALRAAGMAPATPLIDDRDFAQPALVNTGFEQGLKGWTAKGLADIATGGAAEGQMALQLTAGEVLQGLKVKAGQRYRLTVQVKTEAAAKEGTCIQVQFRGPHVRDNGAPVVPGVVRGRYRRVLAATGGTAGWHEVSGVFEVPKGYDEALIYLEKVVDDGTAWFDQLQVTPTDAPALTAEQYQQQQIERALAKAMEPASAAAGIQRIIAQRGQAAPEQLKLAENGKALYAVHVGSSENAIELQAATELAEYLGRISGATFEPLSNDAAPSDRPLLVVGRHNKLTAQLCPDIAYDQLGEDGFVIRSAGPHVVIAGATDRGTLYGVYWLLDQELGVRWYSRSFETVPQASTLTLKRQDVTQRPRFTYREIFSQDTDAIAYRQHNLLNGASHHRQDLPAPAGLDTWSSYWPEGGHNFQSIVSKKAYADHPEYFAGGQLAMMNPAVRKIAADELAKIIERRAKKGKDPSFGFSQEDRGWGADAASRRFAQEHGGTLAAPMVDMINDVAGQVRKQVPQARLATLAYQWSFPAPTNMKVEPYVVMTVAPIEANFSKSFGDPGNARFGTSIAQWAKMADNIVIWDYITNFGAYIQPHPNLRGMFQSIQWLAQYPAIQGYFGQGSYTSLGGEMADLRAWVGARLLWDPKQDADALVAEFVRGYYGSAAPFISQYLKLMQDSMDKSDGALTMRTQATAPYLSYATMRAADGLFEQAEAAVAQQPGFLRRVQTARIGVDYVILLRRAEFQRDAAAAGENWPGDSAVRLDRFATYTRRAGINTPGEGVGSLQSLLEAMRIDRVVPPAPSIVQGLDAKDWVDYQDLSLRRYAGAVVADARASDHGAIRLPGNTAIWGIQMTLDNLPPEGMWKLYARVRVDPGHGDASARAFSLGVNPVSSRGVPVSEVGDGAYHLIELPGGPYKQDAGLALWFAPPKSSAIQAMYVDRVIAVRVKP